MKRSRPKKNPLMDKKKMVNNKETPLTLMKKQRMPMTRMKAQQKKANLNHR